ncbi:MAG TPA: rhomboid family intramembrane serine protease [Longimicrobium sp.]|nr:rhomboid family intramembrane serine protease [Longimicrobium sp.]
MTQPIPEPTPPGPRHAPVGVAPKPEGAPYGYVHGGAHPATREQLEARLREGRPTPLVWTPETDGIAPPWTVPYLFQAYREHGLRHSRKVALTWLAVSLALLGYAATFGHFVFVNGFVLSGFLAASLAFYSFMEWVRFRRLTPGKLNVEMHERRARLPARRGPARNTQMLAAAIALVVLVQAIAAVAVGHGSPVLMGSKANLPSIDAAGIVMEAVRTGRQYWRLLSGAYLHDGLLHFAFNILGILALGRFLEAFTHRAYVPLVFLVTAVAASTASVVASHWTGAEASVGASGGLMGLFGFLAVLARIRRDKLPPGFGRAIVTDIAVIATMGILGAGYVDNAAHGGGFLTGAALGWLMIPRGGRTPYWEPSPAIRALGTVSLAVLLLGALATAAWLVAALFFHAGPAYVVHPAG